MNAIITAVASIFVFGIVIFIHEFGHFITAKRNGIAVLEFSLGMGPALISKTKGETQYTLRLLPIGGYCLMEGEEEESESDASFSKASVWSRLKVVAAGAAMNLLLGLLVLGILTATGGTMASRTVSSFTEGASTEASGLRVDDKILKVNGHRLFIADDLFMEMLWVEDGVADLTVLRDGQKVVLKDVKFDVTANDDGTNSIVLDFYVYGVKPTFLSVVAYTFRWAISLVLQIIRSIGQLITGVVPINQLSGPVGIVSAIGDAASYGVRSVLIILAYISINLGIMNVMPLPALDGGKLVMLIVEAISGKKLESKWEAIINGIGLALLLGLMIFVTCNDVLRLFG